MTTGIGEVKGAPAGSRLGWHLQKADSIESFDSHKSATLMTGNVQVIELKAHVFVDWAKSERFELTVEPNSIFVSSEESGLVVFARYFQWFD